MKNKIYTVGFDGLHRCGKGTQIDMLRKYLSKQEIPHVVLRGDGTRKGRGEEVFDPVSEWWQENYDSFFKNNNDPLEVHRKSNLIYSRLAREIDYYRKRKLLQEVKKSSSNKGVLLLDRSYFSHAFVMRQLNPDIPLEDALKGIHPHNKIEFGPIIPDVTFLFNLPKKSLIERCMNSEDYPEKREFRMENISKHYDTFQNISSEMIKNPKYNLYYIDGTPSPEKIHKRILYELNTRNIV